MYPIKIFTNYEIGKISSFKFVTINTPILYSLFLQSWFEKLQTFISPKIMPNQITWIGYLSMIISLISTVYFDASLQLAPRILPLVNFCFLLVYFCADFLDGIHARKTDQCSQLGALLDHGVDSIVVLAILLTACSSLRLGINQELGFFGFILFSGFYFVALFIKYVGYMKLNLISGQSEGLILIMIIHIIAFFKPNFGITLKSQLLQKSTQKLRQSLMNIIGLIFTSVSVFEILYFTSSSVLSARIIEIVTSILHLHVLLSFLYFLKYSTVRSQKKDFYSFIFTFSQCFTVCYIEETVSFLTCSSVDHNIFIACYLLLASFVISFIYVKSKIYLYSIFALSTLHFLLRIGSILVDLSRKTNCKLFTSSF